MRKRMAVVMFLLIIFAVSCKSLFSPDRAFSAKITGVVTNQETGAPIENARVYMYTFGFGKDLQGCIGIKTETRTDSSGQYYLTYEFNDMRDCSAHWYNIGVEAEGYWLEQFPYEINTYKIRCTTELQINDVQLSPRN